jgi:hypothetical protein
MVSNVRVKADAGIPEDVFYSLYQLNNRMTPTDEKFIDVFVAFFHGFLAKEIIWRCLICILDFASKLLRK